MKNLVLVMATIISTTAFAGLSAPIKGQVSSHDVDLQSTEMRISIEGEGAEAIYNSLAGDFTAELGEKVRQRQGESVVCTQYLKRNKYKILVPIKHECSMIIDNKGKIVSDGVG